MTACFSSNGNYHDLLEKVEVLCDESSGGDQFGFTLDEIIWTIRWDLARDNIQHILARLGKKIKRTVYGTYFYLPNLDTVPKKVRKNLFY